MIPLDPDPAVEDLARDIHGEHCTYLGDAYDDPCPLYDGNGYLDEDYEEALRRMRV